MSTEELFKVDLDGVPITCREGTLDKYIVKEKPYAGLKIKKGDIVFDIGANIGTFAIKAVQEGAKKVYCFEPENDNFSLLQRNTKSFDNVFRVKRALVKGREANVTFYLNTKKNKGSHSMVIRNGREKVEVKTGNFFDYVNKKKPSVIKIDIEGGEYQLLMKYKFPPFVKRLAIEFHFGRRKFREELFPRLLKSIKKQGFKPIKKYNITNKLWHISMVFERKK